MSNKKLVLVTSPHQECAPWAVERAAFSLYSPHPCDWASYQSALLLQNALREAGLSVKWIQGDKARADCDLNRPRRPLSADTLRFRASGVSSSDRRR